MTNNKLYNNVMLQKVNIPQISKLTFHLHLVNVSKLNRSLYDYLTYDMYDNETLCWITNPDLNKYKMFCANNGVS